MKKYVFSLMLMILLICVSNNVYGISKDFKFVIETIGIPR